MLIDAHVHIMSFPSLENLGDKIRSVEDLTTFRTRFPELFRAIRTESPIDNSRHLLDALDKHSVTCALVQARPGAITNKHVSEVVKKHPGRLFYLRVIPEGPDIGNLVTPFDTSTSNSRKQL